MLTQRRPTKYGIRVGSFLLAGIALLVLVRAFSLLAQAAHRADPFTSPLSETLSRQQRQGVGPTLVNLVTNGDMETGFYWRYPNHWIANDWFEWFDPDHYRIPEYTDGNERGFVHSGDHSQRLQLWGGDYLAGILQPVSGLSPCVWYRLEAYGQSRPGSEDPPPVEVPSGMRVGIEPNGWLAHWREEYPNYDPKLYASDFPTTVVWSSVRDSYFVFSPYSVTVEALSTTVTVILYANPRVDTKKGVWWHDTVWDAVSLQPAAPPSGRLPEPLGWSPNGFITQVVSQTTGGQMVVEWDTAEPAVGQVWYRVWTPGTPVTPTGTLLPYVLYLPLVARWELPDRYTPAEQSLSTHHQAVIEGLQEGQVVEFVILSRRLRGGACQTSVSPFFQVVVRTSGSTWLRPRPGGSLG